MPPAVSPKAPGSWTVLDTRFGRGEGLLDKDQTWLQMPPGTDVLHYVAICDEADLSLWRYGHFAHGDTALAHALNSACATALPGIQRLFLQGGTLSLTLCVGPAQVMLSAQNFQADQVRMVLDACAETTSTPWDKWAVQSLARRCRRGTRLHCVVSNGSDNPATNAVRERLSAQGFVWSIPGGSGVEGSLRIHPAEFNPRWELRTTRLQTPAIPPTRRCAVVGAGLAGASVAHALALRGWQVTVLDAMPEPAQGASGLPVGLVVPHVSADNSPRSRLSRAGVRLTLQHARHLLQQDEDWAPTGALEHRDDALRQLAALPGLQAAGWLAAGNAPTTLWHPHAAWIKPARLITAWMSHPNIHWMASSNVATLTRQSASWTLQDACGMALTRADTVVVANASGALALLTGLPPEMAIAPDLDHKLRLLQPLPGTVSHGAMPQTMSQGEFPPWPVNGHGSLISHIPTNGGLRWYAGATYDSDNSAGNSKSTPHALNFQRLKTLWPQAVAALGRQFDGGLVEAWTGTRCVSHDRLPLVGPVHTDGHSGLWLSLAMGSRGLSFAALCAEALAARMGYEPLPAEARLLRSLDVHRPLRHRADTPAD